MNLKDGTVVTKLDNKVAANREIKKGNKVIVFGEIQGFLYLRTDVSTKEELDLAAKKCNGRTIGNLSYTTKAVYYLIV